MIGVLPVRQRDARPVASLLGDRAREHDGDVRRARRIHRGGEIAPVVGDDGQRRGRRRLRLRQHAARTPSSGVTVANGITSELPPQQPDTAFVAYSACPISAIGLHASRIEREERAVVLEQHRRLLADRARDRRVARDVHRRRRHRPVEDAQPEHLPIAARQRGVDRRHRDLVLVERRLEPRRAEPGRGADRGRRPASRDPSRRASDGAVAMRREEVRLHVAVEPPLPPQHVREERRVLAHVRAVHAVVRAHHRRDLAVAHRHLERQQVELVQHAVGDDGVLRRAIRLLLVGDEVLRHRDHAVLLHRADLGHRHRPGQERVLAEVLEVAPALRRAREVEPRPLEHVQRVVARLHADHVAELRGDAGIERRGDRHPRRQRASPSPTRCSSSRRAGDSASSSARSRSARRRPGRS